MGDAAGVCDIVDGVGIGVGWLWFWSVVECGGHDKSSLKKRVLILLV